MTSLMLQVKSLTFTMSKNAALDIAHKVIGGLLITASVGGLASLTYGMYSLYVLRPAARAHDAAARALADASVLVEFNGVNAVPSDNQTALK